MRWLGFIFTFLFRSSSSFMGCFFACFRTADNNRNRNRNRHLPTTTTADVAVSRNRLSSLFLSEERGDTTRRDDNDRNNFDARGLEDEAKFLKACGTLTRTPAEIRKASEKLKVSPSCSKDSSPSRFHSWLLSSSAEKVQLDGEWEKRIDSSEHTPSSCISNAHNSQCDSLGSTERSRTESLHNSDRTENNTASVSHWPSASYTKKMNKSVRFECDTDISSCDSSDIGGWRMKKTESPNPTPMKLSDDMQTPGTVYPATLEDLPNGRARVKSQFVYPVGNNLCEDVSRSKVPEEDVYIPEQASWKLSDKGLKQSQNATSTPEKGLKNENEPKVDDSLSSWLKPASVILEERNKRMQIAYNQIRKTPADRPIIGMVAAHWSEDEDSQVPPPKWWDGNGIPNSTNKYKEDQKVSWHATPFEERLEKALSEESFIPQRKDVCGNPIAFDENEESDTALSQLQPSTHPHSVVSF